jgi:hypothetical protein
MTPQLAGNVGAELGRLALCLLDKRRAAVNDRHDVLDVVALHVVVLSPPGEGLELRRGKRGPGDEPDSGIPEPNV